MDASVQAMKPGLEEWVQAAEVLSKRLSECVHTYKHNTYIFMAQAERQHKSDAVIGLLRPIHEFLDKAEEPVGGKVADQQKHDEEVIDGFENLFREALIALPGISVDMQKLLNSAWMKGFPDKIAEDLFLGNGEEDKGIGSGRSEDGRLPGVLFSLLEREAVGETRAPREADGGPKRHDESLSDRWLVQNSDYLRKAGRMD